MAKNRKNLTINKRMLLLFTETLKPYAKRLDGNVAKVTPPKINF